LLESTAAFYLLTAITVGGVLLLCATGLYMLYQMKLQFVAQQAAQCALSGSEWLGAPRPTPAAGQPTVQDQVDGVTSAALQAMGLPAFVGNHVPITQNTVSGVNTYTVTVTCNSLPLISGGILPSTIGSLSATATASNGNQQPLAAAWLWTSGTPTLAAGGILVPAYSCGYGSSYATAGSSISSPYPSPLPANQYELLMQPGGSGINAQGF
jgi:hypothetical protein